MVTLFGNIGFHNVLANLSSNEFLSYISTLVLMEKSPLEADGF